jgi:hypothetical protein
VPTQPASWLGKARRLLASVVERGLHLPEAATLIRGGLPVRPFSSGPPPVATVTLARIYAAQGHLVRAIGILDEVLVSDPDHELARSLRDELQRALDARKEQERQQQAAAASATRAPPAAAAPGSPEEPDEPPPSEAQLAASELLGAVPELEVPSTDEITLAGTGPAPLLVQPGESAQALAGAGAPTGSVPAALDVQEAETRRGSEIPLALSAESGPEPEVQPSASPASQSLPEQAPESIAVESQPAASAAAAAPAAAVEPARTPGLVLIETSEPGAYLYWELATPALANGASNGNGHGEAHWVCVVAHVPRSAGSERREYRFPVLRAAGAVRMEGLPRHAVVRAKLTRGEAPEAPPLVVAGSVRVGCTAGGCDLSALKHAEPAFLPHPAADPATLAQRAATHLASAVPLYC